MLRPRIIPCLLIKDKGLVKTVGFSSPKYVGDPTNAVKIFNEKKVDELMVLDIDASVHGVEPDYGMVERIAAESRMPLCYGGGVKTAEQAKKIIGLGVEKVSVSSAGVENPDLLAEMAEELGSQSVVLTLDVRKKRWGGYQVWTHNGTKNTNKSPVELVEGSIKKGIGEVVINSIDNDGKMDGYDLDLVRSIREKTTVPITSLGGAGSLDDIGKLIQEFGIIGAAAGSLFVFRGIYKAVLINYPSYEVREELISSNKILE